MQVTTHTFHPTKIYFQIMHQLNIYCPLPLNVSVETV